MHPIYNSNQSVSLQHSLLRPHPTSHYCNCLIIGFKRLQAIFAKPNTPPPLNLIDLRRSLNIIDTCFHQQLITKCSELKSVIKNNPDLSINMLCLSGALDIQRACQTEIEFLRVPATMGGPLNLLLFNISMLRLLGLTNQREQITSRLPTTLGVFLKVATNLLRTGLIEDESQLTQIGFIQLCCSMMLEQLDRHPHHPDVQDVLKPYFDWVAALRHSDGYHSIITPVVTRSLTQMIDGITEQRKTIELNPKQIDFFFREPLSDGVVAGYYVTQMVITALNSRNHRVSMGALMSWVFFPTRINKVLPYFLYALGQLAPSQQGVLTQLLQEGLIQSSDVRNLLIHRIGAQTIRDWLQMAPPLTKSLIKDGWLHMIPLYSYLGAQRWATNYGEGVVLAKGPKLGKGGYAVVRDHPLEGRPRVIKKIDSDQTSSQNWERVLTELTGYQHCLRHHVLPADIHILGIYRGKNSLKCAVVMDKITPIQHLVPMNLIQMIQYASDWLKQLQSMHKVGLLHNDIKPDNLGVNRDNQGVLIDFGLVRPIENRTIGSIVKQTFYLNQLELGVAHDIFAFGISFLACLGVQVSKVAYKKHHCLLFNDTSIRALKQYLKVAFAESHSQASFSERSMHSLMTIIHTCLDVTEDVSMTDSSDITNHLLDQLGQIIRAEAH